MYSEEVMDHFRNPRNMGALSDPEAIGNVGNPVCGDMMKIYLKVAKNAEGKDTVKDIGFETLGCVAAIATSSMITELARGKTLEEAEKIEFGDVKKALGSLPPIKVHCADLSVQALRKAIWEYRKNHS